MTGSQRGGARWPRLAAGALILGAVMASGTAIAGASSRATGVASAESRATSAGLPSQDEPDATRTTDERVDNQDARVGLIVVALIVVALLLTGCTVLYWWMTRPDGDVADEPKVSRRSRTQGGTSA